MRWFETDFDRATADQFVEELHRYTEEFILNYAKEITITWPLTNVLPRSLFKFNPRGAVIHSTETPSIWNALHLNTKHVFGTHFVVMSGKHENKSTMSRFPLLAQLPAEILMLYPLDALVPHSGFVSPFAWGIDLRNAGQLRPFPKHMRPMPIMPSEENARNFKMSAEGRYDPYWRSRLWCYPFEGPTVRWEDYLFELPTVQQVVSLIALLRVLDHYANGMDRRLIIPANCISGGVPSLPVLVWNIIRDMVAERNVINPEHEWLNYLWSSTTPHELHDVEDENESMHGEQMERARWRGERDDGQLAAIKSARQFKLASGYKRDLDKLGYDASDPNFALQLWAISQGLTIAREEDIYSKANRVFYNV